MTGNHRTIVKTSLLLLLASAMGSVAAQLPNMGLKINQIQVIGSHNSYKRAIAPQVFDYYARQDTAVLRMLRHVEYDHIPITAQLDIGLRNIEIDAYVDPVGGKYAFPKIKDIVPDLPPYDSGEKMLQPGFKVIHMPDVDYTSWYFTLSECLEDLRRWSNDNPEHTPVFITFEAKDGRQSRFGTVPVPYTEDLFNSLDSLFLAALGKDKLIVPDDVRGNHTTLNEAIRQENWPTLEAAKGKFLIILDDKERKRNLYTKNHPSLKGRVMFTNSVPGTPEAAALIINSPGATEIPELVKQGYIIRTRADSETIEARENNFSRFEQAKESGAQIITTDYYLKSNYFSSDYRVSFGGAQYVRVNPVSGMRN